MKRSIILGIIAGYDAAWTKDVVEQINNTSFASMKTCIQQPRRGMTGVASHFNGWDKSAEGMRAVGTRPATAFCRVPKGTPSIVTTDIPAIEMAGYHCQMPTASVLRDLRKMNQ